MDLNYFFYNQAKQYTFYQIPSVLFTEKVYKDLSAESKILYGIMLSRMGLSQRNNWQDESGRVYIIMPLTDVMEYMGCGKNKAVNIMKELADIGLIKKKQLGQGKPSIIYVMDFMSAVQGNCTEEENTKKESESQENHEKFKNQTSENCRSLENKLLEVSKSNRKYIDKDIQNNINSNHISSCKYNEVLNDFEEQIDADTIRLHYPDRTKQLDEIVRIATDVLVSDAMTIRISRMEMPIDVVKRQYRILKFDHICMLLDNFERTGKKFKNPVAVIRTSLYQAANTINTQYENMVRIDQENYQGQDFHKRE